MTKEGGGIDVIIRDPATNPKCKHGPTILFSSRTDSKKFFSCAGTRSKDCFFLDYDSFRPERLEEYSQKPDNIINLQLQVSLEELQKLPQSQRIYCKTCCTFIKTLSHHESHDFVREINNEFLKEPSLFLPQLDDDKLNAQYFFDDNTLDFICSMFESLNLKKIICVGAPRLHDYIRTHKPDFEVNLAGH